MRRNTDRFRVEAYLTIRGQEHLAATGQGGSAIPEQGVMGVSAAAIRRFFLGEPSATSAEAGERAAITTGGAMSGTSTPTGSAAAINQSQPGVAQPQPQPQAPGKRNGPARVGAGAAPMVGVQGAQMAEGVKR